MTTMTIVKGDDWAGIYIDNKIICEGHRIEAYEAVEVALEYNVDTLTEMSVDDDWLESEGILPALLEDVKFQED